MKSASLLIVSSLLAVACVTSSHDDEKLSRIQAQEVALNLINSVSDDYDCIISLNSVGDALGLELGLDSVRYSASVGLNGEQCTGALQELRSRGAAFQLGFVDIQSVELPVGDDPNQNLDLIHEINPEVEN